MEIDLDQWMNTKQRIVRDEPITTVSTDQASNPK